MVRIARHLVIHGKVQGVFYRNWTVANARRLGLAGWVRNRPDGTVEAELEGEEQDVLAMIARMRKGPPAARVTQVIEAERAVQGHIGFERR